MSTQNKNPFNNPTFDVVRTTPNVPRVSQQAPKPELMQGAPCWARVAASDKGMNLVLEAACGATEAPEVDVQANVDRIKQHLGAVAEAIRNALPSTEEVTSRSMKHGSDIFLPPRDTHATAESMDGESAETTALLDERIRQLLTEDAKAFDREVAGFDSAALLAGVYETIDTIGRQEVDHLLADEVTGSQASNLDSTVVLTRALDEISEAQQHNKDLRQGEQ